MNRRRLPRPAFRLLANELRQRRTVLARIAAWSAAEAIPALLRGLVIAWSVDRFIAGEVLAGMATVALLAPAGALGAIATRRVFPWLADIVEPVRDALLSAAVAGAVGHAAASARPDTAAVARVTEQVQTVRNILFGLFRTLRQTGFNLLAALIGLALLDPLLMAIVGGAVVASLAWFGWLLPGLAARHRKVLLAEEDVARQAGATVTGLRDAIACGGAEQAAATVDDKVRAELLAIQAQSRAAASRHLVVFVGGQLPLVALLLCAPWLLREGYLSVGELVGAATYLSVSLEPALRGIVGVVGTWGLDLAVTLTRLGENFAPMAKPPAGLAAPERADLVATDLSFRYGPHAAPIVEGFGLSVPDGEHLAIVGTSGIGKSTLADLLSGLRAPQRGGVRIGGVDIDRIAPVRLRRMVCLIPQEAYVFAGTVRENLCYLAPDASDARLTEAARIVGLWPVIADRGGLNTMVGPPDDTLSAGERQLVALTRAFVSPARIVILDEATSGLDPAAEATAEAAFTARRGSVIVIAHRISSARRADRILLLDGDTAIVGDHDELLATCPPYAELVGHWTEAAPQPDTGTQAETAPPPQPDTGPQAETAPPSDADRLSARGR